jgi:tetratricopeptide (TPR) repeat protein
VAPFYTSLALLEQGDVDRSLENLRQGLEIAEQEGITFFKFAGTAHQILLYWSVGAFDRADPLVDKLYRDRDQMVFGFYSSGLTRAARIKLALGDLAQAQKIQADSLQDLDKDSLSLWVRAEVNVTAALTHLALDQPEEALSEAQWLVERTRRAGLKANLTEALLVQGRALAALDELEEAANSLREAARLAEETGQRRLLWQILATLAEVETRQGNAAAAQTARGRAREVIDYIANHAGDSGLRESFLALPEVQSVLSTN